MRLTLLPAGKGAATAYLKNKTREKLMSAIQPQVDAKLNEYWNCKKCEYSSKWKQHQWYLRVQF